MCTFDWCSRLAELWSWDSETVLIGRDHANWLEDGEDGAIQRRVYH